MKVLHTWICFFFLSLCGGDNRLVSATVNIFAVAEGGSDSLICYMSASRSKKFFCKNQCKAEDILVKTEEVTAQNGRFSIKYKGSSSGKKVLSMTISNVTKSDAGRYRFGMGDNLVPDIYCDIEILVLQEEPLDGSAGFVRMDIEGENITYGCNTVHGKQKFLCKGDCQKEEDILIETEEDKAQNGRHSIEYIKESVFGLYVTLTNVTKSDTGSYKCGYGRALSPDSHRKFSIIIIQETTLKPETTTWSSAAGVLPYVIVIIVVTVIVGLTLMIVCLQRRHKPKCLRSRGNSGATNVEIQDYENHPPVSPAADSTYQSLDPASRDKNQIYATVTDTKC